MRIQTRVVNLVSLCISYFSHGYDQIRDKKQFEEGRLQLEVIWSVHHSGGSMEAQVGGTCSPE